MLLSDLAPLATQYAAKRNAELSKIIPPVSLPEGERPTARITRFTLTEEDIRWENLRMCRDGMAHRCVAPGTYTRLVADGELQMTDTPAEKADHLDPVRHATGECLVMGLGIGMVATAMALKPEVTKITVIEKNADVIALVAPHLSPKIEVIHADALTWEPPPGKKWDVIWHDIWPTICLDDCETRNLLSRRYARRWRVYHGLWAQDEIRREQKKVR